MADDLTTSEVLTLCGGIARGTLYRWMSPSIAEQMGIEPFPQGARKDAKSRVWLRQEVEDWLERNGSALHRQPRIQSDLFNPHSRHAVELRLSAVMEAAQRVAEEDHTDFDIHEFRRDFCEPLGRALLSAIEPRGARELRWSGDNLIVVFPDDEEGARNAVGFKLAFG